MSMCRSTVRGVLAISAGVLVFGACASGGGGTRARAPSNADYRVRVHVDVLDRVLRRSDLAEPADGIVAICIGAGPAAEAPLSPQVLIPLNEVYPEVRAASACSRSGPPGPGSVVTTDSGEPALLIGLEDVQRQFTQEISVHVFASGKEVRTVRCSVDAVGQARRVGAPPPPPTTAPNWRVRGC